jgi:hypothetical protein
VPAGIGDKVNMPRKNTDFNIFPNPVSVNTQISWYQDKPGKARIDLMDISGKYVFTIHYRYSPAGQNRIAYDFSKMDPGIYLLKLNLDGNTISRKISKID